MGTIVKKAAVKREKGYLYYVDASGNVCKAEMKRKAKKKATTKKKKPVAKKKTTKRKTVKKKK